MTDQAEIEKWIRDELNRGYDSETIKLQLKQNGYKPNLIDGLVDKVAKEKDANNQAGFQDTAPNPPDNTQANPQMQHSAQNPVTPDTNSPQSNLNENPPTQNPANSPPANSPAQAAQFQNMGFIEKAKMILFNPKGFFNIMPLTGGYKDPIIFFTIILVIVTVFTSLINIIDSDTLLSGLMALAISPVIVLIIVIPFIFILALIYHLLLKIVGGNGTYESTFRVMAYSSVPALFSWIPFVGGIIGFYQLYIALVGYSKVHNISALRALIALLIPIIILIIILIILVVVVGITLFGALSNIEPPTGAIISYFSGGN